MTNQDQVLSDARSAASARMAALRILLSTEEAGVLTEDMLDEWIRRAALDQRDRALAVHLVQGVHRYRGTLDWRLGLVSDRPMARLPMIVQMALRLGAYQLLYMDKIPASAAVNESVQLVKRAGRRLGRDWSGFTNAVLRSLQRTPEPSWPTLEHNPVESLSVRFSCPSWLAERWLHRAGATEAQAWCRASLDPPPLTIRVNTLRTTRDGYLALCRQAGYSAQPTQISPYGLIFDQRHPVQSLPQFQEGAFYVEDEAAQLIPLVLAPRPGERLLDACAAPGGKATHLAALMDNRGEIVAVDQSEPRLTLLRANCLRLGVSIVTSLLDDVAEHAPAVPDAGGATMVPRNATHPHHGYDGILVDAPCTGLGVLRRHPEGKWHKDTAAIDRHSQIQHRLLEAMSRLLRPGGRLVYSTCSTEPEENEQVIDRFCRTHHEFHREHVGSWLPPAALPLITSQGDLSTMGNAFSMDGFYAARLRKEHG